MKFANNKEVFVSYFIHTRDGMEHDQQFQFDGWDKDLMIENFNHFMKTLKMIEKDEKIGVLPTEKPKSTRKSKSVVEETSD